MLWLASLVAGALFLALFAGRANEVFCLSVRRGEMLVLRGGCPPRLRHALSDVVARARVPRATLRAVRQDGSAVLQCTGVDGNTAQRLRNVFDSYGGARVALLQPKPGSRNLGQRLGWAWLAWRLRR